MYLTKGAWASPRNKCYLSFPGSEKSKKKWVINGLFEKELTEDGFKDAFCQNGISLIVNADGALFIKKKFLINTQINFV